MGLIIVGVVIVLLVAALHAYTIWKWQRGVALRNGTLTQAKVLEKRDHVDTNGITWYEVTFTYEAPGEGGGTATYERRVDASHNAFHLTPEVGGTIPIRYLPSKPSVADLDGNSGSMAWNWIFVGTVDLAIAVVIVLVIRSSLAAG